MVESDYENFLRGRITELRMERNVSEHKMSLELGRSGSYIRSITSGISLPSLKELFNIMEYLEISPYDFFAPLNISEPQRVRLFEKLRTLSNEDIEKVSTFISWIDIIDQ